MSASTLATFTNRASLSLGSKKSFYDLAAILIGSKKSFSTTAIIALQANVLRLRFPQSKLDHRRNPSGGRSMSIFWLVINAMSIKRVTAS